MSYQVLARKWRPQTFSELVGQQHVVDAITNALENDKLHHAYLFTGTRGVGKTTIARIFSKSLNCEQGQSANPCGKCATCQDISDGRYVDLLEIDAASRTKVEDTRELLDNVQYRPTRGKYKVYLIDEVHMLSKHSFNALLKTLEEPPEHVKFLLATTDPQKLPVTVLSRCLQFSLKALTKEQIQSHLAYVLTQEQIQYEESALAQLARAAQGSIRDSLSLTDQAIAQGNNQVSLAVVASMLGLLNKNQVLKLVKFICERESAKALAQLDDICSQSPDYFQVLSQTLALLHQIALTQVVPEVCKLDGESAKGVYTLAKNISQEQLQILYQIGINGKRDLPHAPDPRSGLQMTVLRMLAFSPAQKIDLDIDALISQEADLPAFETLQKPKVPELSPAIQAKQVMQGEAHKLVENKQVKSPTSAVPEPETLLEDDSAEAECALDDTTPADTAPVDAAPADTTPADTAPVDAAPADTAPVDAAHADTAPVEPAAADSSTADSTNADARDEKVSSNAIQSSYTNEPPTYLAEQPPLPDEEPPMFNDMFSDDLMHDEASYTATAQIESPAPIHAAQPSSNNVKNDEAEKSQIDQTRALLKVSQQLNEFTAEKQEEEDAKKPETETHATQAVVANNAYQLGHEFATFNGELPAYLENKEKLTLAAQIDEWSAFVDSTSILALARQLLIHSNCNVLSNPLVLQVDNELTHLCDEAIVLKIQEQLSEKFHENMLIELKFAETENTPFQIQTRIDIMRQEYAYEVVKTDNSIQELIKAFDATVIKDSVEAR